MRKKITDYTSLCYTDRARSSDAEHGSREEQPGVDTDPAGRHSMHDDSGEEQEDEEEEGKEDDRPFYEQQPADQPDIPLVDDAGDDARRRRTGINPLYVGVPVAGACVLLAIVIFAIYILRRNNHYADEYHYHEHLKQQNHNHHQYPHNQNLYLIQSRTAYPVGAGTRDPRAGGGIGRKNNLPYPDCERSSSGSETKLLMKV